MNLNCFARRKEFKGKIIYWDTNCYRLLGRIANSKGTIWLDSFLRKLKHAEKKRGIKVKVSYLVLSEMLAHLTDDISSNNYLECKHGLYSALYHTDFNPENLLLNDDHEFFKFITGKINPTELAKERICYTVLLSLNENLFRDDYIRLNNPQFQLVKDYLVATKQNWKDTTINNFIKKHDATHTNNWQIFVNDSRKRGQLLLKLRDAKNDGSVLQGFAIGTYKYIEKHFSTSTIPNLTTASLVAIINRFKPLYDLQFRILELICQSGYNLDNNSNDITDYLIVANLEVGKTLFISNESRRLVPNMHSLGYKKDVWLFDKYCNKLSVSYS